MKKISLKYYLPRLAGIRSTFRSLQYRNYRLFFAGQSISLIGTWMQRIAMPWLVYRITDSAFLLGIVGFAGQIPTFLLAPLAGALVDRWDRRTILIITQILSTIQAALLTILFFNHSLQVWHLIALSIFLGVINAFDMPGRQAFVIDLIEKKEDLGNAIALNSSMFNAARLLGPALAGVIISLIGEGLCFLLNAISYLFVIFFLLMIKIKTKRKEKTETKVLKGITEGFQYVFGFTPIWYIIMFLALISLVGMPYTVLIPVFAKNILHGGSHTFGFLMAASGIGALTAAIYMASKKTVRGLVKKLPIYAGIFGLSLIAFALSRFFLLSALMIAIAGFGMIMQMTSSNTVLQTIVEDDKRGRVMSFYTMAFMGTAPFGSLLAGSLADWIGAPATLVIGGIACLIGAFMFSRKVSTLREMIRPIYVKMGIISIPSAELESEPVLTETDSPQ